MSLAAPYLGTRPQRLAAPRLSAAGVAWCAIALFAILVTALIALRQAALLEIAFPTFGFLLGVLLFLVSPVHFLGYSWWLWFLSPEVRRFVDFHSGWHSLSPVMLTPLIVSGLAGITVLRQFPSMRARCFAGFGFIGVALFYGFVVGFAKTGPYASSFAILNWAVPVLFAFHIATTSHLYERHRAAILRTFVIGTLVMGVYGVIQYFVLPPWDKFWLVNVSMPSEGYPYPMQFRVFSTMHSCGPFAFVIGAGLLLLFTGGGVLRVPSAVAGFVGFALSLVRAAWLGWLFGVVYLLFRIRAATRLRILIWTGCVAFVLVPLFLHSPFAKVVDERLTSFTTLGQDDSYTERRQFYRDFLGIALSDIIGEGIGSTGTATKLNNNGVMGQYGYFDSGVMQIPFVLGWFGTILYMGGLIALVRNTVLSRSARPDPFANSARAIVLATGVMLISDNNLIGVMGMVFWTFLGLVIAAERHARWSRPAC